MPDPVRSVSAGLTPSTPNVRGSNSTSHFREALERAGEENPLWSGLRRAARSLDAGQRNIDDVLRQARAGRTFEPHELLAIQAGVYRYSEEVDLASKLVDRATGTVRHTLQSQH